MSTKRTDPTDKGGDAPCWAHLYDTERWQERQRQRHELNGGSRGSSTSSGG